MSKKQIFDMINANDEDHSLSEREVYQVNEGNNLVIHDEKEAGQVDQKSRNSHKDDFLNV